MLLMGIVRSALPSCYRTSRPGDPGTPRGPGGGRCDVGGALCAGWVGSPSGPIAAKGDMNATARASRADGHSISDMDLAALRRNGPVVRRFGCSRRWARFCVRSRLPAPGRGSSQISRGEPCALPGWGGPRRPRLHQHAARAGLLAAPRRRRGGPGEHLGGAHGAPLNDTASDAGFDPETLGRSRGGVIIKFHLATD